MFPKTILSQLSLSQIAWNPFHEMHSTNQIVKNILVKQISQQKSYLVDNKALDFF